MDRGQWNVVALQLDLLGNSPAVSMRNDISGEVVTISPSGVLDFNASGSSIYASGYLQGYSDKHFDPVMGEGISRIAQQLRYFSGCERLAAEMVPGG